MKKGKVIVITSLCLFILVAAVGIWRVRNQDVVIVNRYELGDEVHWLDELGTVYVPQGKNIRFNRPSGELVVFWDKDVASLRFDDARGSKEKDVQQRRGRIDTWIIDDDIEIVTIRPDVWVITKGKDKVVQ